MFVSSDIVISSNLPIFVTVVDYHFSGFDASSQSTTASFFYLIKSMRMRWGLCISLEAATLFSSAQSCTIKPISAHVVHHDPFTVVLARYKTGILGDISSVQRQCGQQRSGHHRKRRHRNTRWTDSEPHPKPTSSLTFQSNKYRRPRNHLCRVCGA